MNRSMAACLLAAGALVLMLVLVLTPSPALAQAGPPPPAVKTQMTFTTLQMMGMLGGGDDAFAGWDLGFAQGTYVQAFGDRKVTGKILDLGAVKLADGSTCPIIVVEGQVLLYELPDRAGVQRIEKVSNVQDLVLVPKEKIWTAADGQSSVSVVEGTAYIVLGPKGFPESLPVVGVADSKTLYAYPKS
jgi:hypothetical protein